MVKDVCLLGGEESALECSFIAVEDDSVCVALGHVQVEYRMSYREQMRQNGRTGGLRCVTKVQLAHPIHESDMVNQETASDVQLIDGTAKIVIQDAVTSDKNNSQLFKRIEKQIIDNVRKHTNQLLLFTGADRDTRLETSIGASNNPGLFLLTAVSLLDEKYKETYQKNDLHLSIMEHRDGLLYDLLNYSQAPLSPIEDTKSQIHFDAYAVHFNTFSQFLKLFKIALFYNKERDFKNTQHLSKNTSTLTMTFLFKSYDSKNQLLSTQQTILIDIQSPPTTKSLLDSLLEEVGHPQQSPSFSQRNHLLQLLHPYTRADSCNELTFIHTISAKMSTLNHHLSLLDAIRNSVETRSVPQLPVKKKRRHLSQINAVLKQYTTCFKNRSYASMRVFEAIKKREVESVSQAKEYFRMGVEHVRDCLRHKSELKVLLVALLRDQMQLIGRSVKTDSWKDFYEAKSYIQLPREIIIKTEKIKEEISKKHQHIYSIQTQLKQMLQRKLFPKAQSTTHHTQYKTQFPHLFNKRKTQLLSFKNQNVFQVNKFTKIDTKQQFQDLRLAKTLQKYFTDYIEQLWDRVRMENERTIFNDVFLEQKITTQQQQTISLINEFLKSLQDTTNKQVCFEQQNNPYTSQSLSFFKKTTLNNFILRKKKHKKRQPRMTQKIHEIQSEQFLINGYFKLSECLLNPTETII